MEAGLRGAAPPTTSRWSPASPGVESLTLNGLVGDLSAGSVTLAITDNDVAIIYTLSGPEDMNLVEGDSYTLTGTASSAVKADTAVTLKLDAAASSASPDDYSVGNITIAAGETEGPRCWW